MDRVFDQQRPQSVTLRKTIITKNLKIKKHPKINKTPYFSVVSLYSKSSCSEGLDCVTPCVGIWRRCFGTRKDKASEVTELRVEVVNFAHVCGFLRSNMQITNSMVSLGSLADLLSVVYRHVNNTLPTL